MKVIKAKSSKARQKIDSLISGAPEQAAVDRVLVVYGTQDASIYYEASAAPKAALRP